MIKKRFLLILIALAVAYANRSQLTAWVTDTLSYSYCSKPVYFHVQTVDPKFNIPKEKVIENSEYAANLWNEKYGKELFIYKDDSELYIDLLFDERQRLLTTISTESKSIKEDESSVSEIITDFKQKKELITAKITALQEEIEYWNSKGGAPKDIYDDLVKKRRDLMKKINELNKEADKLNQSTSNINKLIGDLNENIQDFNELINVKPEGGLYIPQENKIEIYFYDSDNQFIHITAHELGHALGLDHVLDPTSVMAPVISDSVVLSSEDTDQLVNYCKEKSLYTYIQGLVREKLL